MNEQLIQEIAQKIIKQEILSQWPVYILILLTSFVVGFFGSYLSSYSKKRGELAATKADFDELLNQLKITTSVAEEVKVSVSHADWAAREFKTLRRLKLEELLQSVHESQHWFDTERSYRVFSAEKNIVPYPIPKIERISGLYFPELEVLIRIYSQQFLEAFTLNIECQSNLAELGVDKKAVIDSYKAVWLPLYKEQLSTISKIEIESRKIMSEIVSA